MQGSDFETMKLELSPGMNLVVHYRYNWSYTPAQSWGNLPCQGCPQETDVEVDGIEIVELNGKALDKSELNPQFEDWLNGLLEDHATTIEPRIWQDY